VLKDGALVMLLANFRETPGGPICYANGDLGTVVKHDGRKLYVRIHRTDRVFEIEWKQAYNRELVADLKEKKRLQEDPPPGLGRLDPEDQNFKIIGQIDYLPVRLAYATSVHKSQGLSLDAVQIDVSDGFFLAPSMLYVALSRARTPEGLRLVGHAGLLPQRCVVSPKVLAWL